MTKWQFRKLVRQHRKLLGQHCPLGAAAVGCGADNYASQWYNPSAITAAMFFQLHEWFSLGVAQGWDGYDVNTTNKEFYNGNTYGKRLRKVYYRKHFQCETPPVSPNS